MVTPCQFVRLETAADGAAIASQPKRVTRLAHGARALAVANAVVRLPFAVHPLRVITMLLFELVFGVTGPCTSMTTCIASFVQDSPHARVVEDVYKP